MTVTAGGALKERVRRAIEAGGLRFDPPAHAEYLARRRRIARPVAERIVRRLDDCAAPQTPAEFSLLDGVPMMAAFACSATDCVYRAMARDTFCRDEVRMAFSLFVVSSAAFDHICDEEQTLFPELAALITEERLRGALLDPTYSADPDLTGAPMVRYISTLLDDQLALWWRIASTHDASGARRLPGTLTTMLLNLLRAEFGSRRHGAQSVAAAEGRAVIWRDPLWIACQLVAATPDVAPTADLDEMRRRTEAVGRLFSLIDDVVDLEDDWRTGSSNRLLERSLEMGGSRATPLWEAAGSEEISRPFMDEITGLVSQVSDPLYEEDLGGWLYSWLEP